jgi:hypothetical protein
MSACLRPKISWRALAHLQKSVSRCGKDASSRETVGEGIVADGCSLCRADQSTTSRMTKLGRRQRSIKKLKCAARPVALSPS